MSECYEPVPPVLPDVFDNITGTNGPGGIPLGAEFAIGTTELGDYCVYQKVEKCMAYPNGRCIQAFANTEFDAKMILAFIKDHQRQMRNEFVGVG